MMINPFEILTNYKLPVPPSELTRIFFNPAGATWQERATGVIVNLTNFLVALLATISVLFIVVAGYLFITARGNEEQIGKAKKTLIWAIGGVLIALFAYSIIAAIVALPILGEGSQP